MDACNWTVEAANHTKSTQLNPLITVLITMTIARITYPEKKTWGISKIEGSFSLDIVSTADVCPKCT